MGVTTFDLVINNKTNFSFIIMSAMEDKLWIDLFMENKLLTRLSAFKNDNIDFYFSSFKIHSKIVITLLTSNYRTLTCQPSMSDKVVL